MQYITKTLIFSFTFSILFTSYYFPKIQAEKLARIEIEKKMAIENSYKESMNTVFKNKNKKYSENGFYMTWDMLKEFDYSHRVTLSAIAYCESGFYKDAKNTANKNGSWDGGLWQINSVHKLSNWDDPIANREKAKKLYNNGRGISNWSASKHCWQPVVQEIFKKTSLLAIK